MSNSGAMHALSVRPPWWWFILHGKTIENRSRTFPRTIIGGIWLHASKWWNQEEVEFDLQCGLDMAYLACLKLPRYNLDEMRRMGGKVVGSVEVVKYVDASDSPWFVGPTGIVLRNPVPLDSPVATKGMLGYFHLPDGLIGDAA